MDAHSALLAADRLANLGEVDALTQLGETIASDRSIPGSVLGHIASRLAEFMRIEAAVRLNEIARDEAPKDGRIRFNIAALYRMQGRLQEAVDECRAALAIIPGDAQTHLLLADLTRNAPDPRQIDTITHLIADQRLPWRHATMLHYALGRTLESQQRFADAFAAFARGAAEFRAHLDYSVDRDLAMLAAIREVHTPSALSAAPSSSDEHRFVFVCGLPRSGTSLIEQILQSHSGVTSFGERGELGALIGDALKDKRPPRAALASHALAIDMPTLAAKYAGAMRRIGDLTKSAIIDKAPWNFLYAGLITRAFPRAKIVLVRRNAGDVCAGMYTTFFDGLYPFSYDLEELARYIVEASRLATHWAASLPGSALFILDYEALVSQPASEMRRLTDWLGLAWEDGLASFHQSLAPATTASAVQVRRPISKDNVGAWKRYQHELEPALSIIQAAGLAI